MSADAAPAALPVAGQVLRCAELDLAPLTTLLRKYGMELKFVREGVPIEGSYWGDEEAGLLGRTLLLRPDTPLHSALHEACHYVCMDSSRRAGLDTDAGGGYDEENAVCYLQILLADEIPGCGRARMMEDMDAWGYSFRLGSAFAWFAEDAEDAREWLLAHGLITPGGRVSWRLRE